MSCNPVLPGWHADPELHLFAGRYWIYPTVSDEYHKQTYFEAWTSSDLTNWRCTGRILDFADIAWSTNRAAWAPSCIERDGRYFFYYSAGDGAGLGVAVAEKPDGPFRDALGKPFIAESPFGAQPIDANAFIDDDGQAYLYFGGLARAIVVKLARDMISLDGDFQEITPENYVEGPFLFKRPNARHENEYYLMWSEGGWGDSSYGVAYGRAVSPLGPFPRIAAVLASDPRIGNGAGHNSVLRLPETDQWIIAYHRRPPEETHGNHRVVCLDRMSFDENDNIEPIILTVEGVAAHPL